MDRADFAKLFRNAPASTAAADIIPNMGLDLPPSFGDKLASEIDPVSLLRALRSSNKKIDPSKLGNLGKDAYHGDDLGYARKAGINIETNGGHVPYVTEAHVAELAFLKDQVELNAMSAPQFIEWIERKLVENHVIKVVPPDGVLLEHAAWRMERKEAQKMFDAMPKYVMPPLKFDLRAETAKLLHSKPELSWDIAVASIIPQE